MMETIVLDSASKIEITRRALVRVFADIVPVREALAKDASLDTNVQVIQTGREALARMDCASAEMKQAIEGHA